MDDYRELCKRAFSGCANGLVPYDKTLEMQFVDVCSFLKENPERLSWRGKEKPNLNKLSGLEVLARKYIAGFLRSDLPSPPATIPDEMVSKIMNIVFGYSEKKCQEIKSQHQESMAAENCVGSLLERYINSILNSHGWAWCCGDFVKAIDFLYHNEKGWYALQIKNRNNTENSSSKAIRDNTPIEKWFRTFSKKPETNWTNLPKMMQGYGLSEESFIQFVRDYLVKEKENLIL